MIVLDMSTQQKYFKNKTWNVKHEDLSFFSEAMKWSLTLFIALKELPMDCGSEKRVRNVNCIHTELSIHHGCLSEKESLSYTMTHSQFLF